MGSCVIKQETVRWGRSLFCAYRVLLDVSYPTPKVIAPFGLCPGSTAVCTIAVSFPGGAGGGSCKDSPSQQPLHRVSVGVHWRTAYLGRTPPPSASISTLSPLGGLVNGKAPSICQGLSAAMEPGL